MLALERHGVALEEPAQHDHRLLESLNPHAWRVEHQTGTVVLGLRVTRTQAELEPPVAQQVQRRR